MNFLQELPAELIATIAVYLSPRDVLSLFEVYRPFSQVSHSQLMLLYNQIKYPYITMLLHKYEKNWNDEPIDRHTLFYNDYVDDQMIKQPVRPSVDMRALMIRLSLEPNDELTFLSRLYNSEFHNHIFFCRSVGEQISYITELISLESFRKSDVNTQLNFFFSAIRNFENQNKNENKNSQTRKDESQLYKLVDKMDCYTLTRYNSQYLHLSAMLGLTEIIKVLTLDPNISIVHVYMAAHTLSSELCANTIGINFGYSSQKNKQWPQQAKCFLYLFRLIKKPSHLMIILNQFIETNNRIQ